MQLQNLQRNLRYYWVRADAEDDYWSQTRDYEHLQLLRVVIINIYINIECNHNNNGLASDDELHITN